MTPTPSTNPLLAPFDGPFGLPPFAQMTDDHFEEAFDATFAEARARIAEIAENPAPPSFANTIEALEAPNRHDAVSMAFYVLAGADSTPKRQELERSLGPRFAALSSEMIMNRALFVRIEAIFAARESLDPDQAAVVTKYHRLFTRGGAHLQGEEAARMTEIKKRLASLGTAFSQNVLSEEKDWSMALAPDDLEGLPEFLLAPLAAAAKAAGETGHRMTLSRSVVEPFLTFSTRRDLRQKVFEAWTARGQQQNDANTAEIMAETLALRHERARLLGFDDYASFKLETEMAKTAPAVRELLTSVWAPARSAYEADRKALEGRMHEDGINADLEPWDWLYYAEKRRQAEFDIDEAEIKPYFALDAMIDAAFDVANRLFGLSFKAVKPPLYHPDARAWEVTRDGRHMGLFIGDFFARPSKRSGAWCTLFRPQSNLGTEERPLVVNVCNFAKPAEGQPCLLSFDDARTLFHEFGHALHNLLTDQRYPSIAGTSVPRDFVELPSQLYEHWLEVPDILATHALHVETGEAMPAAMIERLRAAANADQGRETVTYLASALVDLAFHSGEPPEDPIAAEAETLARIDMPPAVLPRHMAAHFQHVFAGEGYASGYYSYMWSEVMDADAFAAFEETGDPFNSDLATRLEEHIYSAGHSDDPSNLYTAFRGSLPKVSALLKKRGLAA